MVKAPLGEIIWERIYDSNNVLRYIVTSDRRREWYYAYKVADGGRLEKILRRKTPVELRVGLNVT